MTLHSNRVCDSRCPICSAIISWASLKDNYRKAVGLAKFAQQHGERFGRIQLIRKTKGADRRDHFYRLVIGRMSVRNKVRGVTSNIELDRISNEDAVTEE